MRKFIYCMVDPIDNSYDYETDGLWTDSEEVVTTWFTCGIESVVALDALSMELITSYDHCEWNDKLATEILESEDN